MPADRTLLSSSTRSLRVSGTRTCLMAAGTRTHDIKETRVEGFKSIYACMQALRLVWHCVTPTGWPLRLSQPQTHLRRQSRQSSVRSDLRDGVLIVSPSCLIICFYMFVQPRTPAGATSAQRHSPAQVSGMSLWHYTLQNAKLTCGRLALCLVEAGSPVAASPRMLGGIKSSIYSPRANANMRAFGKE